MSKFNEYQQDTVNIGNTLQIPDSTESVLIADSLISSQPNVRKITSQPYSSDTSKAVVSKSAPQGIDSQVIPAGDIKDNPDSVQTFTNIILPDYSPAYKNFNFYQNKYKNIEYRQQDLWIERSHGGLIKRNIEQISHQLQNSQLNWALFVGLIAITLLIILKVYYLKFINQVFTTLFNFQLVEKMLREKNVLARRAFLIMNINYLLMFGLFLLLLAISFDITLTKNYFIDYLIYILIILSIQLIRFLLLYAAGLLFNSMQTVVEHLHISYLINKNLGFFFLPVVFSAIYIADIYAEILLFIGGTTFLLAIIYKLIRSFQIFIRNGVLLYYAILYLCTLELLPLVISYKVLMTMR
jgi:hypothetical protein